MPIDEMVRFAHGLGINVEGLTERNKVLTRLLEDAADEVEIEDADP